MKSNLFRSQPQLKKSYTINGTHTTHNLSSHTGANCSRRPSNPRCNPSFNLQKAHKKLSSLLRSQIPHTPIPGWRSHEHGLRTQERRTLKGKGSSTPESARSASPMCSGSPRSATATTAPSQARPGSRVRRGASQPTEALAHNRVLTAMNLARRPPGSPKQTSPTVTEALTSPVRTRTDRKPRRYVKFGSDINDLPAPSTGQLAGSAPSSGSPSERHGEQGTQRRPSEPSMAELNEVLRHTRSHPFPRGIVFDVEHCAVADGPLAAGTVHHQYGVTVDIKKSPPGSSRHQTAPDNANANARSRTHPDTRASAPDVDARRQERERGARRKSEHTQQAFRSALLPV